MRCEAHKNDIEFFRSVWHSALEFLKSTEYKDEKDRFKNIEQPKSASDFLEEYAWVVFTSGFDERKVEEKWNDIRREFFDFDIERITNMVNTNPNYFLQRRMPINNKRKISAIIQVAKLLKREDFKKFMDIEKMEILPYIGKVTKFLLARNIGLDICKPDRWMIRLAKQLGFSPTQDGVKDMCEKFHSITGERIGVIDVVLWRACQLGWKPKLSPTYKNS